MLQVGAHPRNVDGPDIFVGLRGGILFYILFSRIVDGRRRRSRCGLLAVMDRIVAINGMRVDEATPNLGALLPAGECIAILEVAARPGGPRQAVPGQGAHRVRNAPREQHCRACMLEDAATTATPSEDTKRFTTQHHSGDKPSSC